MKDFIDGARFNKVLSVMTVLAIFLSLVFFSFKYIWPLQEGVDVLGVSSQGFSIRADGVILKDNEPFYPFGMYHVSDIGNRYDTLMESDIIKMGVAGFNTVQLTVTGPNAEKSSTKARAAGAKYGMYFIVSYYKPSLSTWLDRLKADPTIMAWNVHDDFNIPYSNPAKTPAQRESESSSLLNMARALGYETLVYGSGGGYPYTESKVPYPFGTYKNSMDIMGVQSYPISNNDGSFAGAPLEENIAYFKFAKSQVPESVPMIANTQTFAWSGGRYPTAEELRNLTWAAIVTRMEGIVAYSFHESNGLFSNNAPNSWNELVALRRDINGAFIRAVMDGTYRYFDTNPTATGKAKIHAATFDYNDPKDGKHYLYVIVMNTSSTASLTTTNQIELPSFVGNSAYGPLYGTDPRYGQNMTVGSANGKFYLNGTLGLMGVQAYRFIELPAPTPAPVPVPVPAPVPVPTPTPVSIPTVPTPVPPPAPVSIPVGSVPTPVPPAGPNISIQRWQNRLTNLNNYTENWVTSKQRRLEVTNTVVSKVNRSIQTFSQVNIETEDLKALLAQYSTLNQQADAKFSEALNSLNLGIAAIGSKNDNQFQSTLDVAKDKVNEARELYQAGNDKFRDEITPLIKTKLQALKQLIRGS